MKLTEKQKLMKVKEMELKLKMLKDSNNKLSKEIEEIYFNNQAHCREFEKDDENYMELLEENEKLWKENGVLNSITREMCQKENPEK